MKFDITTNIIYIVFFVSIYFFLFALSEKKIKKKQICVIIGYLLFMALAFRDLDQGLNDTRDVYMGMYELAGGYSWHDLYGSLICEYTSPAFVTIMKIISTITFGDYRIFIILMSAIFVYPYEKCIHKYCDNVLIGQLVFMTFIYPYGFYLIRQCLSMSILCFAFIYLKKNQHINSKTKKYLKSIVLTALAASIHNIALVFVAAMAISYFLLKTVKVNKNIIILMELIVAAVITLMPSLFLGLLDYLPTDSKYSKLYMLGLYQMGNVWIIPLVVYSIVSIILLVIYKKDKNTFNNSMLILSFMSIIFVSTTGVVEDMVRIAYYFSFPTMVLASNNAVVQRSSSLMIKRRYLNAILVLLTLVYSIAITLPNNNIIYWQW